MRKKSKWVSEMKKNKRKKIRKNKNKIRKEEQKIKDEL